MARDPMFDRLARCSYPTSTCTTFSICGSGIDKRTRFTALLHQVTSELLRDSYYALKREAAPGVDGVRWQEYERDLDEKLADLPRRIHRGTYRAQPSRRA
jgi:hypothetical protein